MVFCDILAGNLHQYTSPSLLPTLLVVELKQSNHVPVRNQEEQPSQTRRSTFCLARARRHLEARPATFGYRVTPPQLPNTSRLGEERGTSASSEAQSGSMTSGGSALPDPSSFQIAEFTTKSTIEAERRETAAERTITNVGGNPCNRLSAGRGAASSSFVRATPTQTKKGRLDSQMGEMHGPN